MKAMDGDCATGPWRERPGLVTLTHARDPIEWQTTLYYYAGAGSKLVAPDRGATLVAASAEINQCVRPAWRYYLLFWPPRSSARVLGVLARGVLGLLARTFDFRTGDGLPRGLPVHRGRLPPQRLRPDGAGLDPPAGDVPLVRVARGLRGLGRRPKYQLGLRGFFGR